MSSKSVCQVAHTWVDVHCFHTHLFGVVCMTSGDFHDGLEKGTASVHQILCQYWENCYRGPHSDSAAFGYQILSCMQVFQWHALFETGHTSVDDEHTGRPISCATPETVAQIQELIRQGWHRTIHDIAEVVGIGYGTCQRVLMKELGMHCVADNFVPRILTVLSHTSVFTQQFLVKQKWLSSSIHRTSLIWHPVTSFYFQKWNWNWIAQSAWHCWQKMTSRKRSKNGGEGGTGVYMWEGTTLRVMAADRPYGEFHDLYSISLEYFGYHHTWLAANGRHHLKVLEP
jgi:hypothetical protein